MKNIQVFDSPKYKTEGYTAIGNGMYVKESKWCISLSFEQEPELGEGESSLDISQYPLEDILDQFHVYLSDFYKQHNSQARKQCVLEFCSGECSNIQRLSRIIGKHVYNKEVVTKGSASVILVIE